MKQRDKLIQRLFKHRRIEGGCWIWTGCRQWNHLYGGIRVNGKTVATHRLSYKLFVGRLGKLFALHKCDVPLCFNPAHLFKGTAGDNLRDAVTKGHHAHSTAMARIPAWKVRKIRADHRSIRVAAEAFKISHSQISKIRNYVQRRDVI